MKLQSSTIKLLEIANKYLVENPDTPEGGYVTIMNNVVCGWSLNIHDRACDFMPGCWAIDKMNNKYLAIGGNDYDGAEEWQMIPHDTFKHEN